MRTREGRTSRNPAAKPSPATKRTAIPAFRRANSMRERKTRSSVTAKTVVGSPMRGCSEAQREARGAEYTVAAALPPSGAGNPNGRQRLRSAPVQGQGRGLGRREPSEEEPIVPSPQLF